ncbi:unnamed protein product [Amoebophrya sp. A120]|nr:unnamed protein product [Amoebophrya sp. A120]|eukprot:GSA120T00021604001.1
MLGFALGPRKVAASDEGLQSEQAKSLRERNENALELSPSERLREDVSLLMAHGPSTATKSSFRRGSGGPRELREWHRFKKTQLGPDREAFDPRYNPVSNPPRDDQGPRAARDGERKVDAAKNHALGARSATSFRYQCRDPTARPDTSPNLFALYGEQEGRAAGMKATDLRSESAMDLLGIVDVRGRDKNQGEDAFLRDEADAINAASALDPRGKKNFFRILFEQRHQKYFLPQAKHAESSTQERYSQLPPQLLERQLRTAHADDLSELEFSHAHESELMRNERHQWAPSGTEDENMYQQGGNGFAFLFRDLVQNSATDPRAGSRRDERTTRSQHSAYHLRGFDVFNRTRTLEDRTSFLVDKAHEWLSGEKRTPVSHEQISPHTCDAARSAAPAFGSAADNNVYSQHLARFRFDERYHAGDARHQHFFSMEQEPPARPARGGARKSASSHAANTTTFLYPAASGRRGDRLAMTGVTAAREERADEERRQLALITYELQTRRDLRTRYKILPRLFDHWAQQTWDNVEVDHRFAAALRRNVLRRTFESWRNVASDL